MQERRTILFEGRDLLGNRYVTTESFLGGAIQGKLTLTEEKGGESRWIFFLGDPEWSHEQWGNWFPLAVKLLFDHVFDFFGAKQIIAGPYKEDDLTCSIALILGFKAKRVIRVKNMLFWKLSESGWKKARRNLID